MHKDANEHEITREIRGRIERDLEHCDGNLPTGHALAWTGYLASLFEWELISVEAYEVLSSLLPDVNDDPAVRILLDRPPKECSDPT